MQQESSKHGRCNVVHAEAAECQARKRHEALSAWIVLLLVKQARQELVPVKAMPRQILGDDTAVIKTSIVHSETASLPQRDCEELVSTPEHRRLERARTAHFARAAGDMSYPMHALLSASSGGSSEPCSPLHGHGP